MRMIGVVGNLVGGYKEEGALLCGSMRQFCWSCDTMCLTYVWCFCSIFDFVDDFRSF